MQIFELILNKDTDGVDAISVVDRPAIESDWVALKEHIKIEFTEVDDDKRILMGAALIPNKQIYRKNGKDEFYVYFSKDTIKQASELFLINGNQNNATLMHDKAIKDMSVVESWIIEDEVNDKSVKYGFSLPIGTWMISMKCNNDDIWNKVKAGEIKGFSIEGYFADKAEMSSKNKELIQQLKDLLNG